MYYTFCLTDFKKLTSGYKLDILETNCGPLYRYCECTWFVNLFLWRHVW